MMTHSDSWGGVQSTKLGAVESSSMSGMRKMGLSKDQIAAMLVMGRTSLMDYCILTQKDYNPNWHHELVAKKLERVEKGEILRLMLFLPPRHGKSELATKKFPGWYLGRNNEKEIICCSYSAELAEEFGRATRDLVKSDVHGAVFPDGKLLKGNQSSTRWRVGKGRGGFLATGVGGSITGMGADILLIDDPIKNREEANSETYRRKVWEWYASTAFTRLEKDGAVVIIQTRWHDDDLSGRILEHEGQKGYYRDEKTRVWKKIDGDMSEDVEKGVWDVVSLPAVAEEKERYREKGEALWEEKYNLGVLQEIKKTIGLFEFSALYQQNPINEEARLFKSDWFKAWKTLPGNLKFVTAVDPAISKRKDADESVVLTLGKDSHHNMYIVEYKHGRWNPSELISEIFRQQERWKSRVGIEVAQYQYSLVHYMKLEQQKTRKWMNVHQVRHTHRKEDRIRGLEPFYRNGLISHPPSGADSLEEQLKRFPSGKHDDIIDALATAVFMSDRPHQHGSTHNVIKQVGLQYTKDGKPFIKK